MCRQGDVLIVPLTGEVPEEADEPAREDGAGAGLLSVPGAAPKSFTKNTRPSNCSRVFIG